MRSDDGDVYEGLSRRDLMKRSAIVGGTVLWASPVIQSLTSAAGAASAVCSCDFCINVTAQTPFGPVRFFATVTLSAASCACVCCCAGVSDSCSNCAGGPAGACSVPLAFASVGPLLPGRCP